MKKKKSRKELRKELEQKERDNSLKDESKSDDFLEKNKSSIHDC